jgi:hypothetical protein
MNKFIKYKKWTAIITNNIIAQGYLPTYYELHIFGKCRLIIVIYKKL